MPERSRARNLGRKSRVAPPRGEARCFFPAGMRENAGMHPTSPLPDELLALNLPEVAQRALQFGPFLAQAARRPGLIASLVESGDLLADAPRSSLEARFRTALAPYLKTPRLNQESLLMAAIRQHRQREMARIALRDLAGWADYRETVREISDFAELCVGLALEWAYAVQCREDGTPQGEASGQPQPLVVIAMGKLGAHELNFSSDIDLIFAYPEEGETRGRSPRIDNSEFFVRLGQRLIRLLDVRTVDGFVFRVDMRLRPFGSAGPLALSFDGLLDYYQTHGRDWERYAWIKARPITGGEAGEQLIRDLQPFMYRRYLDFGALESLREMKAMIVAEVNRKGLQDDIKRGPGGIREVEFIVQAFQLIRGGADRALRERSVLRLLDLLVERGLMPQRAAGELAHAYVFLRKLEHRLQEVADAQTQKLPGKEDASAWAQLAWAMGYTDASALQKALAQHRKRVQQHFDQVAAAPQLDAQAEDPMQQIWRSPDSELSLNALYKVGFKKAEAAGTLLHHFRESSWVQGQSATARDRLDALMPLALGAVAHTPSPDTVLPRWITLLEAIGRRSVYFVLLSENPLALSQLLKLIAASPWIAQRLGQQPALLDELLDPQALLHPPNADELAAELAEKLAAIPADDEEATLDTLRRFRDGHALRVAAADVMGSMRLMVVSDQLTWIAEAIVREVMRIAWRHVTRRDGELAGTTAEAPGFAVIAYGKFGGIELGYGSDLDLVFLYREDLPEATRTGLPRETFFVRLAQRVIHLLETRTLAGVLYEVDPRLRPRGASGQLAASLADFAQYQADEAWTWEHQALVRARGVAGDVAVLRGFDEVRVDTLGRTRDPKKLCAEVMEMREKMRASLDKSKTGLFDLKQGVGGITDLEFLVQYLVLADAARQPVLLGWTDNIRILEVLARLGPLREVEANALISAYRQLRAAIHRAALQGEAALMALDEHGQLPDSALEEARGHIAAAWSAHMAHTG